MVFEVSETGVDDDVGQSSQDRELLEVTLIIDEVLTTVELLEDEVAITCVLKVLQDGPQHG